MRRTFLSWFVITLAICAGAFFAFMAGIPQRIWATDVSMMTSVIAAVFVGAVGYLGWQSWQADAATKMPSGRWFNGEKFSGSPVDTSFGDRAAEICLVLGVIGMALGLAMQGEAIAKGGAAVFGPWATQLFSTITGCVAYAILFVLTYNLECGTRR